MVWSLQKPLLPRLKGRENHEGSTLQSTVINLLKNMVGAGLLNVCIAFKYSSVVGGLLAMTLSSFVCTAGFLMLGYCCSKTGSKTFRELWNVLLGSRTEKVVDLVLFFHTLFSCVGYITLIGDFSVKSCSGLLPGTIFAARREASIAVIVVLFIFPLAQLRNLDRLKYTSAIGLFITGFACCYVFYDVVANATEYGAVDVLRDNFWFLKLDIFKTISLFNGSFSAHYNAPTYYAEMKNKSFHDFAKATFIAFGIATFLFTLFGLAGYARFGDQVMGNVLKSYSPDDPMVQLAWLCMMVSTVFVFPHAFQRMRSSWNAIINKPPGAQRFTTVALLAVSVYGGVAFDDIAVIKMIKGATLGVSIMFIFPALFCISLGNVPDEALPSPDPNSKLLRMEKKPLVKWLCGLMLFTGIGQGALALLVHYKVM